MISFKTGNIIESKADMLVNTVNSKGVMGKGIALQFKEHYPENFKLYKRAVEEGIVKPGKVFIAKINTHRGVKYIANFATKNHWRNPSRVEWIKSGLDDLKKQLLELPVKSIAIPPLGCGHGGLKWEVVKPLIVDSLKEMNLEVIIHEPSTISKDNAKQTTGSVKPKLTPARAMLLFLLYKYRALGEDITEFAAEKLCYFLYRAGETQLKLDFRPGYYGPYSGKVRHVLYAMNGYYLKGFEQKDAKPFDPLELMVNKKNEVDTYVQENLSLFEKDRLNKVASLINGFETPYGLELLATVDYITANDNTRDITSIKNTINEWSERKKNMFTEDHIKLALDTLSGFC